MNVEQFRDYALSKKGTSEDFPFGVDTLVLRVMGKMFALTGLNNPEFTVNLKCDADYALELREQYEAVRPGWHMNKIHWNTVLFEGGDLDERLLRQLIDHSYDQVVATLKKRERDALNAL
jgi:predicted DNA-binding protein (MmcQ/YjbR family)